MSEPPLPEFWTEEIDGKGRRFYSNHRTQTTHWEVQRAHQPPPPRNNACLTCNPRVTFWISAALVPLVWAFSVWATADDNWFANVPFAVVDEDLLDLCTTGDDSYAYVEDFCLLYVSFAMMQLIATLLASIACVLLGVALFRPAMGCCCSTTALGFGSGCVLIVFTLPQLLVLVLVIFFGQEESDTAYYFNDHQNDHDLTLGITFWGAASGFVVAMFAGRILLHFAKSAGDGPLHAIADTFMSSKR